MAVLDYLVQIVVVPWLVSATKTLDFDPTTTTYQKDDTFRCLIYLLLNEARHPPAMITISQYSCRKAKLQQSTNCAYVRNPGDCTGLMMSTTQEEGSRSVFQHLLILSLSLSHICYEHAAIWTSDD